MAGVGSELRRMIPKLFETEGCKCRDIAAKYDRWGVKKCERMKREIVAEMLDRSRSIRYARHMPRSLNQAIISAWVATAIKRAKHGKK